MSPGLMKLLIWFVFLVGLRSLRDVLRKDEGVFYDLLVFFMSVAVIFKYWLILPHLG